MKNNLLSFLAGDFLIEFSPGFGLHLRMRKLSESVDGKVKVEIEKAYFEGPDGTRFTTLKGGLWPFFMTLDVSSEVEETDTHFNQAFVVREGRGSQFAHRGFPALLPASTGRSWRTLLEEHRFKVSPDDLRTAAREAGEYGATCGLMTILPRVVPSFLSVLKECTRRESE